MEERNDNNWNDSSQSSWGDEMQARSDAARGRGRQDADRSARPRRTVMLDDDAPDTYEPPRARQYRETPSWDERPGRHNDGGDGESGTAGGYLQVFMLAAVALLAFISIIVSVASCAASTAKPAAQPQGTQQEQQNSAAAENVANATTTVDENGIVHGTTTSGVNFVIRGAGEQAQQQDKVTFAAVGDQIATDYSLELADAWSGEVGDGTYDFKPFYTEVKPFLQQSDLRYINQETPLIGGHDGWDVVGYPNFASPDSCAEAIADTGFNLVNFTTNHSYDAGEEGIAYSQQVWARYPQITVAGSYADQAGRETVQLVERNGIRFAFLGYTYGDNTYANVSEEPNSYYAVAFNEQDAAADIERAKQVADCIIVSMHWGEEYSTELTDDQKKQAQWLANQGVDLVVGTHAHSIQPVEYYTGEAGKRVPVVFGLGDFVSGWTITDTILSGIFTCDFVKQSNGGISVQNLAWHPTIEWSDGTDKVYVRMLENMSVDEINANTRTEDWAGSSFEHIYQLTNQIITQIPVNWGSDGSEKAQIGGVAAVADASSSSSSSSGSASGSSSSSRTNTATTDDEEETATDDEGTADYSTDDENVDADSTDSDSGVATDDETATDTDASASDTDNDASSSDSGAEAE